MSRSDYKSGLRAFPIQVIIAASVVFLTVDGLSLLSERSAYISPEMEILKKDVGPAWVPALFVCPGKDRAMSWTDSDGCPPGTVSGPEVMFFLKMYISLIFSVIMLVCLAGRAVRRDYFVPKTWESYKKESYSTYRRAILKAITVMSFALPLGTFFMAKESMLTKKFNITQMIIQDSIDLSIVLVPPCSLLILFIILFRADEVAMRFGRR